MQLRTLSLQIPGQSNQGVSYEKEYLTNQVSVDLEHCSVCSAPGKLARNRACARRTRGVVCSDQHRRQRRGVTAAGNYGRHVDARSRHHHLQRERYDHAGQHFAGHRQRRRRADD